MSDADTKVLFDQWPRLHRFALDEDKSRPREYFAPHPTFATLLDMAARCPELESFTTTYFDSSNPPATITVPAAPRHLRSLVFDYVIGDTPPERIAQAIHLLFPSLDVEHDAQAADAASPSENLRPGTWPWSLVSDALKKLKEEKETCVF